jgi:hypothetical protein
MTIFVQMKISIYLLLLFSLGVFSSFCQDNIQESRSIVFDENIDDSIKLVHISQISNYYKNSTKYDSVLYFLDLGIKVSEKSKSLSSYELDFMAKKGWLYIHTNRYYEAIVQMRRLGERSKEVNDANKLAVSYLNIASVYVLLNEVDQAQEYVNKVFERINDLNSSDQKLIYGVQGQIDRANNNYKSALKNLFYARKMAFENDEYYGDVDLEIGFVFDLNNQSDSAIYYIESAYKLSPNHPDNRSESAISLAKIRIKNEDIASAIDLLFEAVDLGKKIGNYDHIKEAVSLLFSLKVDLSGRVNLIELHELYEEAIERAYSQKETQEFYKNEYKNKVLESRAKTKELKLKQKIKERETESANERKQFIIVVIFSLIIISLFFIYRLRVRSSRHELSLLLKEIEFLKEKIEARSFLNGTARSANKVNLDRAVIESKLNVKLNDTDWKVLVLLVDNPSLTNSEIAESIFLSYEGVRSSLKRLYNSFDISGSTGKKSMRMNLILATLGYSNEQVDLQQKNGH